MSACLPRQRWAESWKHPLAGGGGLLPGSVVWGGRQVAPTKGLLGGGPSDSAQLSQRELSAGDQAWLPSGAGGLLCAQLPALPSRHGPTELQPEGQMVRWGGWGGLVRQGWTFLPPGRRKQKQNCLGRSDMAAARGSGNLKGRAFHLQVFQVRSW